MASPPRSRNVTTAQPAGYRPPQVNAEKLQSADTLEQPGRGFLESPWTPAWALGPNRQLGPVGWGAACLTVSRGLAVSWGLYSCRRKGQRESGLIKLHTPGMDRTTRPQPQGWTGPQATSPRGGEDHRPPTPQPWQWVRGRQRYSPQAPHGSPSGQRLDQQSGRRVPSGTAAPASPPTSWKCRPGPA